MKKIYDAPVAEKVDFDYEENVVASGVIETKTETKCGNTCKQDKPYCPSTKPKHFWFFWWCWW